MPLLELLAALELDEDAEVDELDALELDAESADPPAVEVVLDVVLVELSPDEGDEDGEAPPSPPARG